MNPSLTTHARTPWLLPWRRSNWMCIVLFSLILVKHCFSLKTTNSSLRFIVGIEKKLFSLSFGLRGLFLFWSWLLLFFFFLFFFLYNTSRNRSNMYRGFCFVCLFVCLFSLCKLEFSAALHLPSDTMVRKYLIAIAFFYQKQDYASSQRDRQQQRHQEVQFIEDHRRE